MQKIDYPFAGSTRAEDGAIEYTVLDEELKDQKLDDEETLRAQYKLYQQATEVLDLDPEDDEAWNNIWMTELMQKEGPFEIDEWNEYLDKELGTFKKGEKYDFVKDLKAAY